jgi:hypothetical protein
VGRELILSFGIIKCEAPIRSLNWTENGKWLLIGESSRFAGVAVTSRTVLPISSDIVPDPPGVRGREMTFLRVVDHPSSWPTNRELDNPTSRAGK